MLYSANIPGKPVLFWKEMEEQWIMGRRKVERSEDVETAVKS